MFLKWALFWNTILNSPKVFLLPYELKFYFIRFFPYLYYVHFFTLFYIIRPLIRVSLMLTIIFHQILKKPSGREIWLSVIHTLAHCGMQKSGTPKDVHISIFTTYECVTSHGTKGLFADVIKLLTLRWGDYPGLPGWTQSNHMSLEKQRIFPDCGQRQKWGHKKGQRNGYIAGFEDEGMGPWATECRKMQGNGVSPTSSRKNTGLLTSWFLTDELHVRLLSYRNIRRNRAVL